MVRDGILPVIRVNWVNILKNQTQEDLRMPAALSFVIPVFNEESNIRPLYNEIAEVFKDHEIEFIYVDDGSSDNSVHTIESLKDDRVKFGSHEHNLGIWHGWKTGCGMATNELICLLDADLQNDPKDVLRMLRKLEAENLDLVQGARSSISDRETAKKIQSRVLGRLLNWFMGSNYADPKSGFILMKHYTAKQLFLNKWPPFYFPHTYIRYMSETLGFACADIETLFRSRRFGVSSLGTVAYKTSLLAMVDLFLGLSLKRRDSFTKDLQAFLNEKGISASFRLGGNLYEYLWFFFYRLTWRFHKWTVSPYVLTQLKLLFRSEKLTKSQLQDWQTRRLNKLLVHAYNRTEYYRKRFDDAGYNPHKHVSLSDLHRLPPLTKDDVRQNIHFALFASGHNKQEMQLIRTSGSTGEPFRIYCDKEQLELRMAATLRGYWWAGWRPYKKQIRLWHQKIGMTAIEVFKEKVDAFFMRRRFIPAFEMDPNMEKKFIDMILTYKPSLVDGYAESLEYLSATSDQLKENHVKIPSVVSSAQELSSQARGKIETNLNSKVFDKYGAREFSGIAYQRKESSNYFCTSELFIVEVLKDGRPAQPGEIGEVYVTDLSNWNFPIIRYQIGDLSAFSTEPDDNQPFQQLEKIYGRTRSIIKFSNGSWQPSSFFLHLFKEFEGEIARFQVIQKSLDRIEIKIKPGHLFSEKRTVENLSDCLEQFCPPIEMDFQIVDEIPLGETGKYLPVVSQQ